MDREALLYATVMDNRFCVQKPLSKDPKLNNFKQATFLQLFDQEVLYGGAAGGAKSSALLMAALQFAEVPGYSALILRRTFKQLAKAGAIMDRAHQWLASTGAHWSGDLKTWTFPSGARLEFGHIDNENDKYNYQGPEYQFIGFDELTQFTQTQYTYLFSRLRRLANSDVPIRMRAGSNPGGIGHEWVKKRFVASGATRTFIQALLSDNPYLDRAEYIKSLAELDPFTRAQLLAGSWDDYTGGRFLREWLRYFSRDDAGWYCVGQKKYYPEQIVDRFITLDPAASAKQTVKADPDYSVISSWGFTPCRMLLWLGCLRLRVEVPDLIPRLAEEYARHKAGIALVESGGMQKSVSQLARRHDMGRGGRMNIVEVNPVPGQKILERSRQAQNAMQAGRIWLPSNDPGFPLDDVVSEVVRFTGDEKKDSHDDIVQSLAMAARRMENVPGGQVQQVAAVTLREGLG